MRYIDVQDYVVFVSELTDPVLWKSFLHPRYYSLFWGFFLWCLHTGPAFLWLGLCTSSNLNSAFVGSSGLTQLRNQPDILCALMGALGPLSLTVTIDMVVWSLHVFCLVCLFLSFPFLPSSPLSLFPLLIVGLFLWLHFFSFLSLIRHDFYFCVLEVSLGPVTDMSTWYMSGRAFGEWTNETLSTLCPSKWLLIVSEAMNVRCCHFRTLALISSYGISLLSEGPADPPSWTTSVLVCRVFVLPICCCCLFF